MNRFVPFLVIDPHQDDNPGSRDAEEASMEVRGSESEEAEGKHWQSGVCAVIAVVHVQEPDITHTVQLTSHALQCMFTLILMVCVYAGMNVLCCFDV